MYSDRIQLMREIEAARNSRVILYVTGDRRGMETKIGGDTYDYFVNLLDDIGSVHRLSLVMYTNGGLTLAAWKLVNLIQQFCNEFEVIIPHNCLSAGTLIAIGAKQIVMTKQATLGPIDPSITTLLNPKIEGGAPDARMPISVEAVNGYIELAKSHMKRMNNSVTKDLLIQLSQDIHPHVLGEVFRSQAQIKMLARKLLGNWHVGKKKIESIISFLCSESGSHDYTIHRKEARKLGINIENPDETLYVVIKNLYNDFATELKLRDQWNAISLANTGNMVPYSEKRALVESTTAGSYFYASVGD